jgi:chromosome transmission fidelity protein 1
MTYQLLNPAPHFRDVVDVARSVVLAGGTMSPVRRFGLSEMGGEH